MIGRHGGRVKHPESERGMLLSGEQWIKRMKELASEQEDGGAVPPAGVEG